MNEVAPGILRPRASHLGWLLLTALVGFAAYHEGQDAPLDVAAGVVVFMLIIGWALSKAL